MATSLGIAITFDSPALLHGPTPVTPRLAMYLSEGDPLTWAAITEYATYFRDALKLTSIYQLGDAIMANILNRYALETSGIVAETLIASIADAEGARIDSLVAYNNTGSSVDLEVIVKDSLGTQLVTLAQSLDDGKSAFIIGGFDKVNLNQNDYVEVKSSVLGVDFYASTVVGVAI